MNIQLTGDSIMARFEGYEKPIINHLLEKNASHTYYNTAISGQNTNDFLAQIEQNILSLPNIDRIFILLGANDLALNKQVPLERFIENIKKIITLLKRNYRVENIYFISPPPVNEAKQRYRNNRLVECYTQALQDIYQQFNCPFINLSQAFFAHPTLTLAELTTGLRNDGLHFGEAGYQVLAALILNKCD